MFLVRLGFGSCFLQIFLVFALPCSFHCLFILLPTHVLIVTCPFVVGKSRRSSCLWGSLRSCCKLWRGCKDSCQYGSWLSSNVRLGWRSFGAFWQTRSCKLTWGWGAALFWSRSCRVHHVLTTFSRQLGKKCCIGCFCFSLLALAWRSSHLCVLFGTTSHACVLGIGKEGAWLGCSLRSGGS